MKKPTCKICKKPVYVRNGLKISKWCTPHKREQESLKKAQKLEKARVRKENAQWTSKKADEEFSKWIRARDKYCLRCGTTKNLTNSHFWSRKCSALRYEPDNCITLCWWKCHKYGWENEKQGEYRDFMIKRLGQKRYDELQTLYYQSKMTRREAISICRTLLSSTHLHNMNIAYPNYENQHI